MSLTLIVILVITFLISSGFYFFFIGNKFGFDEKVIALAKAGKFKEAKTLVKEKIDLHPSDIALVYLLATVYKIQGDLEGEASELEKIAAESKYTKEITQHQISSRLGSIYYQLDKYDEAFFYYLDLLDVSQNNLEAIVRIAFMAIGQKEFEIANRFLKMLPDSQIKLSAFFIAKGVVHTMLGKDEDFEYYQKAYELDKNSVVAQFLYAFGLYQRRQFKDALKIVDNIIDTVPEEYIKFTFLQFLMVQYLCLKDYSSAMLNARLCIDLSRKNNWEGELSESNFHYSIFCIASNDLEKASEYLIEAEYLKPHDTDIINLANYKMDLEEGLVTPGSISPKGFNFTSFLGGLPEKLFPHERAFEISGLKMPFNINIRGIINKDGKKLITKISQLSPDKVIKFNSLRGLQYKNACAKILNSFKYKIKKELPCLESEGANLLAISREDEDDIALFRFRRWKQANLSDIFLSEMQQSMLEVGAFKGFLVASCDLTIGAKKFLKANDGKITIINDNELDGVLESSLG
jgi:tetratricopeptide (TPR) repeat protein